MKFTGFSLSLIFFILADFPYFGKQPPLKSTLKFIREIAFSFPYTTPYPITGSPSPPPPNPTIFLPPSISSSPPPSNPCPVCFSGLPSLRIYQDWILKIFSGSHKADFIVARRAMRLIFGFPVRERRVNHWVAKIVQPWALDAVGFWARLFS